MRILLRKTRTGKYLQPPRRWTSDLDQAWSFTSVSQALAAARQRHLSDMELVWTDLPPRIGEVPIAELTLAELLALKVTARPAARRVREQVHLIHGGGYAFYVRSYDNLIARFALATKARTFALDYRLTPEHPFPAQLQDALAAYEWLLLQRTAPQGLLIAGDSAGGNLALALLLALRDRSLPMPRLTICLSPWVDLSNSDPSMVRNARFDWVERRMPEQWAEWFCNGMDPTQPQFSPLHAQLHGLSPMYIQAGGAELIIDSILAFARRAKDHGAEVQLEVWPTMIHDFQAFGKASPYARDAWSRLREVVFRKEVAVRK